MERSRICFISARSGVTNGGALVMELADARLINEIARQAGIFSVAYFHDPEQKRQYSVQVSAQRLYPMPFPFSYSGGIRNFFRIRSILLDIQRDHDFLIIQLPIVGFHSLMAVRKPVIYHICANVLSAAANKKKYTGLRYAAARAFAGSMHAFHKMLFRRKHVKLIVHGRELARLYQPAHLKCVVSSSIVESEIASRDSVKRSELNELKLIFIGRPSLQKGFDLLIEALLLYAQSNDNFTLTVIGFDEAYFRQHLTSVYQSSVSIHNRIVYKGYRPWNEETRLLIRQCHFLMVPSLGGEGTPRVIFECMSQGTPCIASNMDGIPDVVDDEKDGLLFWPLTAEALCERIKFGVQREGLWHAMSYAALTKSKNNTIEHFAAHFVDALKEFKHNKQ